MALIEQNVIGTKVLNGRRSLSAGVIYLTRAYRYSSFDNTCNPDMFGPDMFGPDMFGPERFGLIYANMFSTDVLQV
jgi:hypothetical protein